LEWNILTLAILPSWASLFRALWKPPIRSELLAAPWCRDGETAGWFSRSAWSLAQIALWRLQKEKSGHITVWIPDYFCNSSLTPIRELNTKLVFYPINENLQPDYKACKILAQSDPPDLFLIVHYFGCPFPAAPASEFCFKYNAWLIEDAAHVLRPISGVGKFGDFVLYSPHKLLPVPDGAVLVVRSGGPGRIDSEELEGFGTSSIWSKELAKHEILNQIQTYISIRSNITWLIKRIVQKTGISFKSADREFVEVNNGEIKEFAFPSPKLSLLSHRLLSAQISMIEDAARLRIQYQLLWDHLFLEESNEDSLFPASRPNHNDWTPYLATFLAIDEKITKKIYESLLIRGLPVTTWPDLPPEVSADRVKHELAWRLRHNRIYLPLHQSLVTKNIILKTSLDSESNKIVFAEDDLEMKWNKTSRKQWNKWIHQTGRSNLLQSWAYGEAKSNTSGWIVHRIVIQKQNQPIAFAQVLEKKLLPIHLFRLNRGPLFIDGLTLNLQESVIKLLTNELGAWKKGRLLFYAPELLLSGKSLTLMSKLGFRQFTSRRWESIWIDLSKNPDVLRKNLTGKWRNMLSYAERQEIQWQSYSDVKNFEWLNNQCSQMMKEHGKSIPVNLYNKLQLEMKPEQPMQVLKASSLGKPIAGICVASHGSSATYLLGWNGDLGRNLKANQLLLWNAMMLLKEQGIRWFDLGGIDEDSVPGISHFKLGVNGERYTLIGDGLLI